MFTLRCTRKLLARLGSKAMLDEVQPTTRLGDWYANLLFRPAGQVVLFVNEKTLLPVLVPARPAITLLPRFRTSLLDLLLHLGIPAAIVQAERHEMEEVCIGKTASRQVLGVINDFAVLMDAYRHRSALLEDISIRLASAPCSPIGMKRPMDVAMETLGRA